MSRHSRNDIALRKVRGFASTAGYAAAEGQKHLSSVQQKKLNRIREGLCPECGGTVPEEVRLGRVVVSGHVVRKCDDCRKKWRDYEEARRKRLAAEGTPDPEPEPQEDVMAKQTLLGERLQQADELIVAKRHFDANKNSVILIVGGRTTNIQRNAREHPRVVMWESTDMRGKSRTPVMPTNVGVVMCTRFCSHQISDDIRSMAQQRKAFLFSGLLQSGEMRRNLATLLDLDASKVDEGADDTLETPPIKVVPPQPPPTPPARQPAPAPAPPPARTVQPVQELETMPLDKKSVVFPVDGNLDTKIDDAISMVGEAIAALTLVKDQLEQSRAAIAASAEGMKKLKVLKELLGGL